MRPVKSANCGFEHFRMLYYGPAFIMEKTSFKISSEKCAKLFMNSGSGALYFLPKGPRGKDRASVADP
jgi:hypothetical protein